jgi:membrane carboxypeptidase/penicillin-binding protein
MLRRSEAFGALRGDWLVISEFVGAELTHLQTGAAPLPPIQCQCLLVSGEDHRHRLHLGFDPLAILRAAWRGCTDGRREGASTIDQQIVRVVTGRYEITAARKVREIVLAVALRRQFPASGLPALYLHLGYYGWRMNGFQAACRRLGFDPELMTLWDAAQLVARLKYPEPRSASTDRLAQIRRRARHLTRLYAWHQHSGVYSHLLGGFNSNGVRTLARTGEPICAIP